ncbi:MAG: tetratricopeptide repeat protein [Candidatus Thorarchaeota archaeon]
MKSNPYNFERPITNPEFFAGREEEKARIDYYLKQTQGDDPRFYNIAIIGEANVGKSSMLNIARIMAKERSLLSIKIILNRELVENHLLLYKEIFDGILNEGKAHGMFSGVRGRVTKRVKRIGGSVVAEIDLPFTKLTFGGGKDAEAIGASQQELVKGLRELHTESKKKGLKGIVIMFDECDLFSNAETLLQKIGNAFQELEGYMLFFSGSEAMFSTFGETVSPLPRSFVTIRLNRFTEVEETKECVLKPLSQEERSKVDLNCIHDIHRITQGSPYEITLVSHFMYKKFQEGKSDRVTLSVEVLDDILGEIDRLRSIGHHEVASKIAGCFPPVLKVLLSQLEFNRCSMKELSCYMLLDKIETLTVTLAKTDIAYNEMLAKDLVRKGISTVDDDGYLSFEGKNFDRLYLKYLAISKGIDWKPRPTLEPIATISDRINDILTEGIKNLETFVMFDKTRDIEGQVFTFSGRKAAEKPGPMAILFSPSKAHTELYQDLENALRFRINVKYLQNGFIVQLKFTTPEDFELVSKRIDDLKDRFEIAGIEVTRNDEITIGNKGLKLLSDGKISKAIKMFDEAIGINPRLAAPYLGKAFAYYTDKKYTEALEFCDKAIKNEPAWSQAWELKGRCLFDRGEYQKAIPFFNKAIEYDSENWIAWDNKGRSYLNMKQFQEAKRCFEIVYQALPSKIDMLQLYSVVLIELEENEKALEILNSIIDYEPDNIMSLGNKGIVLNRCKRYAEAVPILAKAAEREPNNLLVRFNLGYALLESGSPEDSIPHFDAALNIEPKLATAWYNKACAFSRLERIDNTISALKKAIELDNAYLELARKDSDFDNLRANSKFRKITED